MSRSFDPRNPEAIKGIEPLLNVKDVGGILNVSLPCVYKMVERGQLPCVQWEAPGAGTRRKTTIRFKKQDILTFIERHSSNGNG